MEHMLMTSEVWKQDLYIGVKKPKHFPKPKYKLEASKRIVDSESRAKLRMRNMHRIYHSYKERLKHSLKITNGHGLSESDLKHDMPCIDCIVCNESNPPRKHFSKTVNSFEEQLLPGEGWCFDGGDVGHYSHNGYRYPIVFVDIRSKKKVTYYCKTNNAVEFKQAVGYLSSMPRRSLEMTSRSCTPICSPPTASM